MLRVLFAARRQCSRPPPIGDGRFYLLLAGRFLGVFLGIGRAAAATAELDLNSSVLIAKPVKTKAKAKSRATGAGAGEQPDSEASDSEGEADLHLPLLPGSDVALYHGLLHLMLWEGWVDAAFI